MKGRLVSVSTHCQLPAQLSHLHVSSPPLPLLSLPPKFRNRTAEQDELRPQRALQNCWKMGVEGGIQIEMLSPMGLEWVNHIDEQQDGWM